MIAPASGKPTSWHSLPQTGPEQGVAVAGLATTVHPAASAGPNLRASMDEGKLHGVIAPAVPAGWRAANGPRSAVGAGTISPRARRASSTSQRIQAAPIVISPRASAKGLPCSAVSRCASDSRLSFSESRNLCNKPARHLRSLRDQSSKAREAAATARPVSPASQSGTWPGTFACCWIGDHNCGSAVSAAPRAAHQIAFLQRSVAVVQGILIGLGAAKARSLAQARPAAKPRPGRQGRALYI